jgi:hypothetical protein
MSGRTGNRVMGMMVGTLRREIKHAGAKTVRGYSGGARASDNAVSLGESNSFD